MHSLETINKLNSSCSSAPHPLYWHCRIAALRRTIGELPVSEEYREHLRFSLYLYAEQIVERPIYKPDEGWDDLEALQQVALGDLMGNVVMSWPTDLRQN